MNVKDVAFSPDTDSKKAGSLLSLTSKALDIATTIRRKFRNPGGSSMKQRLETMRREGSSSRDIYAAGWEEGRREELQDLTDVLFSCQEKGLGRMSIIQESNTHLVVKVYDCASCQGDSRYDDCSFVAGFIAGALVAAGKPESVNVKEKSCGEYPGRTCVFAASW